METLRADDKRERLIARLTETGAALEGVGFHVDAGWEAWARRVLAFADTKPRWVTGEISWDDAMLLYSVVRATSARARAEGRSVRAIEVGVASGVSSAVILAAINDAGAPLLDESPHGLGPALRSYDIGDRCYFDPERAVGEAALEMTPGLLAGWALRTGADAIDAGAELERHSADVAFIDADHRHPWPTIDALAVMDVVGPGGWIVLHDVRLEALAARHEARTGERVGWKHKGARVAYEAWPLERVRAPGAFGNIGAVRTGRDEAERARVHGALLTALRDEAWEGGVANGARRALERLGLGAEGAR